MIIVFISMIFYIIRGVDLVAKKSTRLASAISPYAYCLSFFHSVQYGQIIKYCTYFVLIYDFVLGIEMEIWKLKLIVFVDSLIFLAQ